LQALPGLGDQESFMLLLASISGMETASIDAAVIAWGPASTDYGLNLTIVNSKSC